MDRRIRAEPGQTIAPAAATSALGRIALGLMAFNAVGAAAGAIMLWLTTATRNPFGMWELLSPMRVLPLPAVWFDSTVFPGLALLVVIAIPHGIALVAGLRHDRRAPALCLAAGVILAGWIGLQFVIFVLNPTTTTWGVIAVAEIALGLVWSRQDRQARRPARSGVFGDADNPTGHPSRHGTDPR